MIEKRIIRWIVEWGYEIPVEGRGRIPDAEKRKNIESPRDGSTLCDLAPRIVCFLSLLVFFSTYNLQIFSSFRYQSCHLTEIYSIHQQFTKFPLSFFPHFYFYPFDSLFFFLALKFINLSFPLELAYPINLICYWHNFFIYLFRNKKFMSDVDNEFVCVIGLTSLGK